MKNSILITLFCILLSGCMKTLEIPVVETWEGRYSTVKEFQEKTKDINLKDGQSIWVISNGTMYRILKKAEK